MEVLSKSEILESLRAKYCHTIEYLDKINGNDHSGIVPVGLWAVYDEITSLEVYEKYFSPDLLSEIRELRSAWDTFVESCEKQAYESSDEIRRWFFPWFDELDLKGNLKKQLTSEQMTEYRALIDKLPSYLARDVHDRAFQLIDGNPESWGIFVLKKWLDERLIDYLEHT
jgi:hypothetical protein